MKVSHRHVKRLGPTPASIVHQQAQLAKLRHRRLNRCDPIVLLGHIAGQADGASTGDPNLGGYGLRSVEIQITDDDRSAGFSERTAMARPIPAPAPVTRAPSLSRLRSLENFMTSFALMKSAADKPLPRL